MSTIAPAADDMVVDWYRDHFARLVRIAGCMLGGTAGAEDVAQEALFRAWEHRGALDHRESIGPWLTRVVRNLCVDALRRDHEEVSLEGIAEPADPARSTGDTGAVVRAMSRINPRQRDALYMHALAHVGYGDLARRMGIAEPAARMVIVRARRALKAQLGSTLAASA